MADFYDWSQTAASNDAADSTINWAENQAPDTVNDSARNMMKRVAEWRSDLAPMRTSAGSSNAYTVTSAAGGSGSYRDGEIVAFVVDRACTSSCTLNVNSRGAVAFRPAVGVEFKANELVANQPVIAYYRSSTNEWLAIGTGYHVDAMTNGLLAQSISARLIRIGQPLISFDPTVTPGCIRLTESTQTLNKADWPELSSWLSTRSTPYPWGSTTLTFNLPPAAGYFLRFAALSTSIDPGGARTAGSTQQDALQGHYHNLTNTSSPFGQVNGASPGVGTSGTLGNFGSATPAVTAATSDGTNGTPRTASETRAKNVAFHCDVFASTAISAGTIATFGWPLAWDTGTTAADPGSGRVRVDNATPASATTLYISETDQWGADISGVLGSLSSGCLIKLSKVGAQANYLLLRASGTTSDAGSYRSLSFSVISAIGSFSNNDQLAFEIVGVPGSAGATGPAGGGIPWTWDTGTTAADPGAGKIRGDNATLTSVTNFYVNNSDANSASETAWLDALDDSTNTVKGYLQLTKASASSNALTYRINSVSGSSYRTISVTYVSGTGTFSAADSITLTASRAGDAGGTGSAGSDAGIRWLFATSTTMADPSAGNVRFNNATLASVTALAISYSCGETGNPSVANTVKAWDDSTTTAHRGYLTVKKVSAPQNYVVFDITGALTDNTTWAQVAVTVVDSAGSLSASDVLSVQFSRTGDAGAGSFTSLTPGAGVTSDVTAAAPGSAITTSGTLSAARLVNAQVGTTYTVVDGDRAKLVTFSNASSIAVTLPQAGAASAFVSGWFANFVNLGAGTVTITPTTSTINGASTFVLRTGQGVMINSDGTNYQVSNTALSAGSVAALPFGPFTSLASASTADLSTVATVGVNITGTTTITSFGTGANLLRIGKFAAALTLTHNATTLILPSAANITTAAGDTFVALSDGSGNWTVVSYTKADGTAVVGGSGASAGTGLVSAGGSLYVQQFTPGGRLTLTSATPILTSDASAQTTLYYAPHAHGFIPVYNGTDMILYSILSSTTDAVGLSLAMAGSANWASGSVYDVFYAYVSGSLYFGTGPAWSSTTSRGTGAGTTELQRYNGIWTNKVSMTLRNAAGTQTVPANQGTYLGSFYASANGTTTMVFGGIGAGGTAGQIYLWNQYNQAQWSAFVGDSTDSWTYASTTIRASNNSSSMRVTYLCGDPNGSATVLANFSQNVGSGTSSGAMLGVEKDATTTMSGQQSFIASNVGRQNLSAVGKFAAGLGVHYISANEVCTISADNVTFYGDNSSPGQRQSGLTVWGTF